MRLTRRLSIAFILVLLSLYLPTLSGLPRTSSAITPDTHTPALGGPTETAGSGTASAQSTRTNPRSQSPKFSMSPSTLPDGLDPNAPVTDPKNEASSSNNHSTLSASSLHPSSGGTRASISIGPSNPSTVIHYLGSDGINQTGSLALSCGSSVCFPPDVQVAAGPNQVIEMVNNAAAIFSKQGALTGLLSLRSLYGTSDRLSDPKIIYDSGSGRWFSSIIDINKGAVMLAVSNSTSLTGFKIYTFFPAAPTTIPDQPILGLSSDKVVLSTNDFSGSSYFLGAQYWVINKNDMVGQLASVHNVTFAPDPNHFSVHPVHSMSLTNTEYMVSIYSLSSVHLFSITGLPGVSNVTVSAPLTLSIAQLQNPVFGAQPGTFSTINVGDLRILDGEWFQNKLWYALSDGCFPVGDATNVLRSCIRLTEIDTSTSPPRILQDFDSYYVGGYLFYPAISIDASGNLAVIYGFSSSVDYPSLAITGQAITDPLDTLRLPQLITRGSAADMTGTSYGYPRYGDYFGAALDPSDTGLVWVAGEYHNLAAGNCYRSGNCWSTFVAKMRVTGAGYTTSANPGSLLFSAGFPTTSTLTISSFGGFSGGISFASSSVPAGLTATFNPSTLSLSSTGSVSTNLGFANTGVDVGNYTLTVSVISGSQVSTIELAVAVAGFALSSNPASIKVSTIIASSATATLTLTSVFGFAGSISLSTSVSNSTISNRPTASISPSSASMLASSTALSTLTVSTVSSTPIGNYIVNVTATSKVNGKHLIQVLAIPISVPQTSFTVSGDPVFYIFSTPSSTGSILVTSWSGFSGTVSLTMSAPPNSLTFSLSPTVFSIGAGQTGVATLTVTGPSVMDSAYTVNITGTSGATSHILNLPVAVGGEICFGDPSAEGNVAYGVNPCPSVPWVFNGPLTNPPSQLKVGIYVRNSVAFVAFDIILKVDPKVLYPVSADDSNSVLPSPVILAECVNGRIVVFGCSPGYDTDGTIEFAAQATPCCTGGNISGTLFTATFNIVGRSPGSTIGFQSGCNSQAGNGDPCAFIVTNFCFPQCYFAHDAVQTGIFASGNLPYATLSANTYNLGPVFPAVSAFATLTATSWNNFPIPPDSGQIVLSATSIANLFYGFGGFPQPPQNQSVNLSMSVSSAYGVSGNFTFTVYGTYTVTNSTACAEICFSSTLLATTNPFHFVVQDLSITPSPTSITVVGGSGSSAAITFKSINGFSGRVNLTSFVSPSVANAPVASLNVSSIMLTSGGSAGVSLTFTTTSFTPARNYGVGPRASTALGTKTKAIIVHVQGFSISISPSASSLVLSGSSGAANVTLKSLNGFAGTISLTATSSPSGPVTSIWPYTVILSSSSATNSTLSFTAGAATAGVYTVAVTGTTGSMVLLGNLTLTVTGDYSLSTSASNLIVPAGSTGQVTYTATSASGFSGEVYVAPFANVVINATGINDSSCRSFGLTFNQALASNFWTSQPSSVIGNSCTGHLNFAQIYGMSPGSNYLEFGVNATSGHWHVRIYVNSVLLANVDTDANTHVHAGFQIGSLATIFATGYTSYVMIPSGGSASGFVSITTSPSTVAGNYTVTLTGTSGGVSHSVSFTVQVVDFTMSAPSQVTFNANSNTTFTVTLTSLNRFSGTVSLSTSVSNSNIAVSCSPLGLALSAGSTGTSNCTLNSLVAGSYTITVTAASGGISHSASVTATVTVPDFSITAPGSINCVQGAKACSYTVTVTSLNGFTGTVNLAITAGPAGATVTISPTAVTLSSGGTATATVTIKPPSSGTVTVQGTSGNLAHSVSTHLVLSM